MEIKTKLSDAEDLAKLYFQFWEPHKKVDPLLEFEKKMTLKNQIKFAKKDIKKASNHILVADRNGKVIGFIEFFVKKNESCFKIKKYGYLNSATTDKHYRGKGIAKALTNGALKFLKKKGIKYAKTNVYDANKLAMKVWIKLGFKPKSTFLMKKIK
ncbi:MAG: GNAT family N-acetyltransferase [Nanoarchaeota archaeon]